MKCRSIQQFAIVTGDTAQLLEERLNARLIELHKFEPKLYDLADRRAVIEYKITETSPENIGEEYQAQGVRFTCEDCPYFEPALTGRDMVDRRIKYGDCQFAINGRTRRDASPCDVLWNKLKNGEVELCLVR